MTMSNMQLNDTGGVGSTRSQAYKNNIAMNFQSGRLNSAVDKTASAWGSSLMESLRINMPNMVPADNGIMMQEYHNDEAVS